MTPHSPRTVATIRGLLLAVVTAALGALITGLSSADAGDLAPYVPVALVVLRALEAVVLDRRQGDQAGLLGG